MPRLLFATPSPYSAKVRMAATHVGIAFEAVPVATADDPKLLTDANPLGKIPVLITDEGEAVHDSRVITQYLNRISGNRLFPRNTAKRLEAEKLEAMCDGLCDCLLAIVYEHRMRPSDMVYQPWVDRQWAKAERVLTVLNEAPPKLPKTISAGHIALRAAIGYLAIRFEGKWEKHWPKLKRWAARFDEKFPMLAVLTPKA